MTRFAAAALFALSISPAAQAIVWAENLTNQQVINFGTNDSRFQGIGRVFVGNTFSATGTYIGFGNGSHWVLTARHVIEQGETGSFRFRDGGQYTINAVFNILGADISVARLSSWNRNVWTPTITATPTFAVGTNLVSAGYGRNGQVGNSPWQLDDQRRGMTTRLHAMQTRNLIFETGLAVMDRFDAPADANFTSVEGFGAPGDSGSPLIDPNGNVLAVLTGGEFEQYGALNWYSAITTAHANEIARITAVPEPASMTALGLAALALLRRRNTQRT